MVFACQRIQVNGLVQKEEIEAICSLYPDKTIITQHTRANEALLEVSTPNHAILIDGSGGRGISPTSWVRPTTTKSVGFAGGLGAENLIHELPKIESVAITPWWVDMEQKLRNDDDRFSISKALRAISVFHSWQRIHQSAYAD